MALLMLVHIEANGLSSPRFNYETLLKTASILSVFKKLLTGAKKRIVY